MMELRQLRYFQSIAELGSLTKASHRLRITQPALTRQIHNLEHDLGVELFARHSRGVELTSAGTILLSRTGQLMDEIMRLRHDVSLCGEENITRLRIGVSPGAAQLLIPSIVATLRELHKSVEVSISEGDTASLHKGLEDDVYDVAITHHPRTILEYRSVPLISEQMVLVSAPQSSPSEEILIEQMKDLQIIAPSLPNGLREFIADAFASRNMAFTPAIEVNGYAVLKAFLLEGGLHAIVSYNCVAEEIRRGELAATRIINMPRNFHLSMIWKRDMKQNRAMESLARIARERAQRLLTINRWSGDMIDDPAN